MKTQQDRPAQGKNDTPPEASQAQKAAPHRPTPADFARYVTDQAARGYLAEPRIGHDVNLMDYDQAATFDNLMCNIDTMFAALPMVLPKQGYINDIREIIDQHALNNPSTIEKMRIEHAVKALNGLQEMWSALATNETVISVLWGAAYAYLTDLEAYNTGKYRATNK